MKKQSYSFFDFLGDIINSVISDTGKPTDPYNINFTNHYKTLYNVDEELKKEISSDIKISEIVQNKRQKSLTIKVDGAKIEKNKKDEIVSMFNSKNIECDINNNKLNSFTITKNSKGVLEEREWQN